MTGFYKRAYNELENQISELLIEQENKLASYEKIAIAASFYPFYWFHLNTDFYDRLLPYYNKRIRRQNK